MVPIDDTRLKVALVHDDLTQRGGAEQVVLSLHRLFPEAPIYTSIYAPEATYPEFGNCDVRTTWLQRLPARDRLNRAFLPLYPVAFDGLRLSGYDLVVSSSSRVAHGARVVDGFHLCYCHSPARFLYGDEGYFEPGGPVPRWARPGLGPVLAALRRWDQQAARRPHAYVANSKETARRIELIYGREATVIYPPVSIERFPPIETGPDGEPYYLVVSRLLPYKRVDLAIVACARKDRRLVVVGTGPAWTSLRRLAGPRVEFRTRVSDEELNRLLHGCVALIQAGVEDLGLGPLEANAAGRPAVALAQGGALETVVDGVTGVLFPEPSVDALVEAMDRVERLPWRTEDLRAHARAAAEDRFHRELVQLLSELGVLTGASAPVDGSVAEGQR